MAGKRSVVWQFFTAVEDTKAKCDLCKTIISHKSTVTNLMSHLSRKHPTIILPNPKMTIQPIRSATSTATGDLDRETEPSTSRSTVSIMPAQPAEFFLRRDPLVGTSTDVDNLLPLNLQSMPKTASGVRPKAASTQPSKRNIRFRCDFPVNSAVTKVLKERPGWIQVDSKDDAWDLYWCDVKQNHLGYLQLSNRLENEYMMFVEEYKRNPGATWIAKPASGCQGRGIFLFQKLRDLTAKMRTRDENHTDTNSGVGTSSVVQRYIESPYLLAGRKFDLRIYALVTSFSPLKIWLAREGFARLTGVEYSLSTIKDNRVHLTNVSIQKSTCRTLSRTSFSSVSETKKNMSRVSSNDEKQKAEAGSNYKGVKWNLRRLRQFLSAKHGEENVEIIFQRIARLITVSLRAVQPVVTQDTHCFELYGYDIILDINLYPWILEVNSSPAMVPTDKKDYRLKYDLISDVLNVLDFEGKLTGNERRVGGFDLIWNDGPIYMLRPGSDCGAICYKPAMIPTWISQKECIFTPRLNAYLGCLNDRSTQLENLEECIRKWKKIQIE